MRIGTGTRSLGWIYLFCFSCFPALAQQNGNARSPEAHASVTVDVANHPITLDVVVTDKAGHAAGGLQQQDFVLLDNKAPQKITSFRAVERPTATADPPVEVILLVDEVNAPVTDVARQRQAIEKFLKQNDGELVRPVSIVFFSDTGTMIGNTPSQDGKTLIAELNRASSSLRVIGRSQGVYGAADRLPVVPPNARATC
jgi:VWFA-related protein